MTTPEILSLAGPQLDQAVLNDVFNLTGKCPAFSTDEVAAAKLFDKVPGLFAGSISPLHPKFDPARPFVAGTLTFEPSIAGDVTSLRVTGANRLATLCKAALLVVCAPAKAQRPAPPAVRTQPAPQMPAKAKGRPARPVATRQPIQPRPPFRPQPSVVTNRRPPLPARNKKFIPPTPFPAAGPDISPKS